MNDQWTFEIDATDERMVCIKSKIGDNILYATNEGDVIVKKDIKQLWMKGTEDNQGYFTLTSLTNHSSKKVLTAVSEDSLQTIGMLL